MKIIINAINSSTGIIVVEMKQEAFLTQDHIEDQQV